MVIMAVDVGTVRTGVAVSDKGESFAFPKTVITERNRERLAERICELINETEAEELVIGLPKNMDGTSGFKAEECTAMADILREKSGLPVHLVDERCTTVLAHDALNRNNVRGKKRKEVVDAVAAVMILEDYLKLKKNKAGDSL